MLRQAASSEPWTKALAFETLPVHLLKDGGQQHAAAYVQVNPQQLVPVLLHGRRAIRSEHSETPSTWGLEGVSGDLTWGRGARQVY